LNKNLPIIVLFTLIFPLTGQKVLRVVNEYVAIQNENIGKTGEPLVIRRVDDGKETTIGIVRVIVSKQGITAVKIEKEYSPYKIQPGDMAYPVHTEPVQDSSTAESRNNRRWRIRFGLGAGRLIGDLSSNIPPDWSSYHNKLKTGFQLFSDVAYFSEPSMGLGLMISQWHTSYSANPIIFYDKGTAQPVEQGSIKNNINVLFIGPAVYNHQRLVNSHVSLTASASVGVLQFMDNQKIEYIISANSVSEDLKDRTLGIGVHLGLEYPVARSLSLSGSVGFIFGTLPKQQAEGNLYQDRISLNRMDFTFGLVQEF
jgi:hypothetical protein